MDFNNNKINNLIKKSIKHQTTEWYKVRDGMITATNLKTIIEGDEEDKNDLLDKKLYNIRTVNTTYTLHGQKFEPIAINILEKKLNIDIKEVGFVISENKKFLGATPDGITIENNEVKLVEIKCPPKRQIDGLIPYGYYMQIQLQLYVCNIEECLYFECNLEEITKEKYNNLDDDILSGYHIDNNCYWILHEFNLIRIKRDRDFMNIYLNQLNNFHKNLIQLKKSKNNKKRKLVLDLPSNKRIKLSNLDNLNKNYILYSKFIKDYKNNNKCDTWLSLHGDKYLKNEKIKNKFSEQLFKRTTQIKKKYINKIRNICNKNNFSYISLPNYYKLTTYLEKLTKRYIKSKYDVIINPILYSDKLNMYSKPFMIMKGKIIKKIYGKNKTKILISNINDNDYFIINKACKNLKFIENGNKLSKDNKHIHYYFKNKYDTYILNDIQKNKVNKSIIIGTKWNYTVDKIKKEGYSDSKICLFKHNLFEDKYEINKYKNWVYSIVNEDTLHTIYNDKTYLPCYSKNENSDWSDFKKKLLKGKNEVSLLYGIGKTTQKILHNLGIYSWKDSKLITLLQNDNNLTKLKINKKNRDIMLKIIKFNCTDNKNFICPTKLNYVYNWLKGDKVEFYVDFETINDFLGDVSIIYLIGMYCKLPNNEFKYYSFFSEQCNLYSEKINMNNWLNKIKEIKKEYNLDYEPKIYCWSKAEQSFINSYNRRHKTHVKLNLVDMLEILKKEKILVKENIYGFSIKDVVKYMYKFNLINRNYKLDCNSGDLSIISAIKYYKKNDKKEYNDLIKYNETDCIVMYDIIKYFRNFYLKK